MASEQRQYDAPYSGVIVKLTGRPERAIAINESDIHELKIALYSTRSVDEFIKAI